MNLPNKQDPDTGPNAATLPNKQDPDTGPASFFVSCRVVIAACRLLLIMLVIVASFFLIGGAQTDALLIECPAPYFPSKADALARAKGRVYSFAALHSAPLKQRCLLPLKSQMPLRDLQQQARLAMDAQCHPASVVSFRQGAPRPQAATVTRQHVPCASTFRSCGAFQDCQQGSPGLQGLQSGCKQQ